MASTKLIEAILKEDFDKVDGLIKKGIDVNESTVSYISPLGLAIAKNNTRISQLLIANGSVLPPVKCASLGYPLLLAVDKGNVELVRSVLATGSKFVHGPYQTCPLVSSVRRNDVTMVKLLLTAPRCNSGTCRYYETILHDALFAHNAVDAACLLLESKQFGFEFRSVNLLFILLGMTAELRFRHAKIGSLLLQYGADIAYFNRYSTRSQTPSMCFMWHQRARTRNRRFQSVVRMLLLVGILPHTSELYAIEEVIKQTENEEEKEYYTWVQDVCKNPLPLQTLCRKEVRVAVGLDGLNRISDLPLPANLKNFVTMQQI